MPIRRIDGARSLGASPEASLVAIGNFDGVHRGHRAVLGAAVARARARGLAPLVLTFDPHPAEVLGRGRQAVLTPMPRKIDLICRVAPELRVVVEPFTLALAATSPRDFADQLLLRQLGARVVIVGSNFRFGHRRQGDLAALEALGQELGFEAGAEPLERDPGGVLSSSRARQAVADGDLAAFEAIVGRPHALTGRVVRGDQRGRSIGFPTANLSEVAETLPPFGVYACLVDRVAPDGSASRLAAGVANIGTRPTVAAGFSVEAHLFDLDTDVYGETLRLHLVARLRDERRFPDLGALVAQITDDVAEARALTAGARPEPEAGGAWF